MNMINKESGTNYKPFNYYGSPDAEKIIVAMGSVCETVEEVVEYLEGIDPEVYRKHERKLDK